MSLRRWGVMVPLFCFVFFCFTGDRSFAVNYDDEIQRAQQQKTLSDSRIKEIQKELDDLLKDKEGTLEYIEKLDKKTEKVEKDLTMAAEAIKVTKENIKKEREELDKATEKEKIQYSTMKRRIKYMYENGSQDYIDIVFSSKNISDLLNRTEYIEKISDYDKKMFVEYDTTKKELEKKSKQLNVQLLALEDYEYEEREEKKALQKLKKQKKEELKNYNKKEKSRKKAVSQYAKQVAQAQAEVEKLLRAKQKEIDQMNPVGAEGTGGDGTLVWPLNLPGRISSAFGKRKSPTAGASTYHKGLDIAISAGTPILAAGDGTVVTATYSSSAGNYIMISHGNRLYTVYMHCSQLAVRTGDTVAKGQVIGLVGSTGISTGAHLHFGVSKNGRYVNPLNYVKQP